MNRVISFCELKEKEVVNMIDGRKLGHVIDMTFTLNGCVMGIIVPGSKRFFKNISSGDTLYIPWKNICKIGDDVILVELNSANVGIMSEEDKNT